MSQTITPVRYTVTVPIPAQRAFTLFTEGFNTWWIGHHIGEAELAEAVLEPRVDGRWYERGVDGTECDWGKVLVHEPPSEDGRGGVAACRQALAIGHGAGRRDKMRS